METTDQTPAPEPESEKDPFKCENRGTGTWRSDLNWTAGPGRDERRNPGTGLQDRSGSLFAPLDDLRARPPNFTP